MKVKFFCDKHLLGAIPNPVPAVKAAPEYFKKIKPQVGSNPKDGTVKRCVPFLDAISAGFIIPMWCDVYVFARNGELSMDFPHNFPQSETLGSHSEAQIPNSPLSNKPYGKIPMKWVNPWVIETEPGVSCIFTPPLNHMEARFKLLDGVVDTDTYHNNINFPFLWTGGDGEFFIAKGTPLVQVIPFRREEQHLEVSFVDAERRQAVVSTLGTKIKNGYRDELWHGGKSREEAAPEIKADPPEEVDNLGAVSEESSTPEPNPPTDAELLHQNGYVPLLNIITQADAEQLTAKLREHIEQTGALPDSLCPKSQAVHGMPDFDELLEMLTPVVSEASGKRLVPTYSYARMYVRGERLPKHIDRPACQYSVTLCLGMSGEPWPIFMAPTATEQDGTAYLQEESGATEYMGEPSAVHLGVGDAVLYRGMDMVHYREAFEGEWQAQVFLHWVDADGPHADHKYDGRLALSHRQPKAKIDDNVVPLTTASAMASGILEVTADDTGRGFGEGDF